MNDQPQLTRLRRVDYYLNTSEQHYNAVQGVTEYIKKDEKIPIKNSVWKTTEAITKAGIDPNALKKSEIIAWADHALFNKPAPIAAVQKSSKSVESSSSATSSQGFEIPVGIAIYSLLLSAIEVAKLDRKSGHEKRLKSLEELTKEYCDSIKVVNQANVAPQETKKEQPEVEVVQSEIPTPA